MKHGAQDTGMAGKDRGAQNSGRISFRFPKKAFSRCCRSKVKPEERIKNGAPKGSA